MPRRQRRALPTHHEDDAFDMSALQAGVEPAGDSADAQWTRLQAQLSGLLGLTGDARVQLEPRHAHASWLVVHLTRVENAQPQARNALAKRLSAVLSGVATICAAGERLRLRENDHLAFWTRVLTSQMMARPLDHGDVAIWWFARHVRAREVRIKIQWSGRKLERSVLEPVKTFLRAEWSEFDRMPSGDRTLRLRSMRVALCVTNTQLTPRDLELLGDVLSVDEEDKTTTRSTALFQPSLASLEISDTVLTVDTLRTLASRVYSRARPIDELRLEAIFPSGPLGDPGTVLTPEYAAAFKSVLVAALDATHCRGNARPVALSLAHNSLHVMHLQALFDALRGATRDLASLSLQRAFGFARLLTPKLSEGLMKALEAIAFRTSNPSDEDTDCELDLSGSYISQSEAEVFRQTLTERVTRTVPLVRRALGARRRVTCRVAAGNFIQYEDGNDQQLHVDVDYRVVAASENGTVRIRFSSPHSAVDVPASDVLQLAVDGKPLVQSRFTHLFLDADVEGRAPGDDRSTIRVCACANKTLLKALGPRLTFLSMRWCRCGHQGDLHDVIAPCRRLRHLNLEGSHIYAHQETHWARVLETMRQLETLNLNATVATHWMVQSFVNTLVQIPDLALKRLSLAQNQLRPANLEQFQLLLDVLPSIQLLEIDSIGRSDAVEDYISGRRDLTRDYHGVRVGTTPVSSPSKRAFLSVVRTICDGVSGVEPSILNNICVMAEDVKLRQILWRGSKQT